MSRTGRTVVAVIGALMILVALGGALDVPGALAPSRLDRCVAAAEVYADEFGWRPEESIRTWCEHTVVRE